MHDYHSINNASEDLQIVFSIDHTAFCGEAEHAINVVSLFEIAIEDVGAIFSLNHHIERLILFMFLDQFVQGPM